MSLDEWNDRAGTMIADIHKIREAISDAHGGDIHAISGSARMRHMASDCVTVSYHVEHPPTENKLIKKPFQPPN